MKKRLSLFFIILLVLSLTACGVRTESIQSTDEKKTDKLAGEESDTVREEADNKHMKLQMGEYVFTATLASNSSAEALKEMLEEGPIIIAMRDYANMEKVGSLGTNLPRNDEQITTEPGDLILYQGNAFVIYYAPNSWNFTRIGKIEDVTQAALKEALGNGDVKVTLSLE
ncbi:hypothetical protein Desor_2590 [Desulfosporosinus orientis DSM 765]|uniref:Cyclophilin-like domain-containing protein n=1 Tax=Desulfosporosinus orientis (strain ATCC 19365 / DSM 765 / NCIMB 8382 / VKM B-1628 / Singapore I) TaxID=768706 RepID=G7W6D3_DESOD|nr:cyclophilin-like fold protein [Desulfosporosinus orientis]AET68140.1 hypothetical protein Desor_2590 [Desulfosporosinus orientis DSM 765]